MVKLLKTDVFIADPYNENHITLYKEFEQKNNLLNTTSKYLEDVKEKYTKKEYNNRLTTSNENTISLFLTKNNKISDFCLIKYEKDRKIANVTYPKIEKSKRKIIAASSVYIFNVLSLEEMFVSIDSSDDNLIANLIENGFEPLGKGTDTIEFIKEKPLENEIERTRKWK